MQFFRASFCDQILLLYHGQRSLHVKFRPEKLFWNKKAGLLPPNFGCTITSATFMWILRTCFTPMKKDMYRYVIFPRFTFAVKIVLYIIMASEVLLHFHAWHVKFKPEKLFWNKKAGLLFANFCCTITSALFMRNFRTCFTCTYEKRYSSKCTFSALRLVSKICCNIVMDRKILPGSFTLVTSNSNQKIQFWNKHKYNWFNFGNSWNE